MVGKKSLQKTLFPLILSVFVSIKCLKLLLLVTLMSSILFTIEEQWEKDLEAELQDYEVVNDGNDKVNWEKDVEELLEEEDLK